MLTRLYFFASFYFISAFASHSKQACLEHTLKRNNLTSFLSLIYKAEEQLVLKDINPSTLLAPTNEAFERWKVSTGGGRLSAAQLRDFIQYHILDTEWDENSWANEQLLPTTLYGASVRVNKFRDYSTGENVVTIGGAKVLHSDSKAANGAVHMLDSVLFPIPTTNSLDTIAATRQADLFLQLIEDSGFFKSLRYQEPLTMFVPIDEAFERLPNDYMTKLGSQMPIVAAMVVYHVVNGTYQREGLLDNTYLRTLEGGLIHVTKTVSDEDDSIQLNAEANVLSSQPTTTGVVHFIDRLLTPPPSPRHMIYAQKPQQDFRRKK